MEEDQQPPAPRFDGVVKFFSVDRHFGFVERSDGERDVFLHISSLERIGLSTIDQGTAVRFDIIEDRKQPGRFKINNIELVV